MSDSVGGGPPPARPQLIRLALRLPYSDLALSEKQGGPIRLDDSEMDLALVLPFGIGPNEPRLLQVDEAGNLKVNGAPRSISDGTTYELTLDWQRRLATSQPPDWWLNPVGRILGKDDFEAATFTWTQIAGAVARDLTTSHGGAACLKLTTGAVAGNQAVARKFFALPADQGYQKTSPLRDRTDRVIVGCWFRQADLFLRSFAIRLVIDDSQRQREFWLNFNRRNAGVDANAVQYMNSGGVLTTWNNYAIDAGGNPPAGDVWNFMDQELDYLNGTDAQGGYGYYRTQRFGDFLNKPAAGALVSFQGASAGARFCFVDLIATTDLANACSVFVDDFMLTDSSNKLNQ